MPSVPLDITYNYGAKRRKFTDPETQAAYELALGRKLITDDVLALLALLGVSVEEAGG